VQGNRGVVAWQRATAAYILACWKMFFLSENYYLPKMTNMGLDAPQFWGNLGAESKF